MKEQSGAPRDQAYEGRALVAVFPNRDAAHAAAKRLHDEGFRRTWIGVTQGTTASSTGTAKDAASQGGTVVKSEGETLGEKIERFFSGESGGRSLYDELVRHGVAETEARRIDRSLEPNTAILTVDGSNHPELAAQIIEQTGGHILAGESFAGAAAGGATTSATAAEAARGSSALGYGEPTQYARGESIDEARRLQLREERLNVEKRQVPAGEVEVGKEVVEHPQRVDVPTVREELFIERREPSSETRAAATDAIGQGEPIRIPLMREQVVVTKRPVVTGEYVVGKRQVEETQGVSETTREERLTVDDRSNSADARDEGKRT
jgi:uncharacterized protein (TIGR02271 family)